MLAAAEGAGATPGQHKGPCAGNGGHCGVADQGLVHSIQVVRVVLQRPIVMAARKEK